MRSSQIFDTAPAELAGTMALDLTSGTHYLSIPAITCIPQGTAIPGDRLGCSGGGMLRTDGDADSSCWPRSRIVRDTYICHLPLPSGAILEEIIANGFDYSPVGYLEAAVWAGRDSDGAIWFPSAFSGTWQNSGISFNAGHVSFPIFRSSDLPHTIQPGNYYMIGFGLKSPDMDNMVFAQSFRVRYTL
jgi:hypothetical protein